MRLQAKAAAAALTAQAATAARHAEEASAAREVALEESLHAHIAEKRRRRAVKAMAKDQSRAIRAMARLPPMEEKDKDGDGSDSPASEQIRLDPFCVFNRYCRKDGEKCEGKGKADRG